MLAEGGMGGGGGGVEGELSCHSCHPLSLPDLRRRHSENAQLEIIQTFPTFAWAREKTSVKMHSTESRFVIGPTK